MENKEKIMTGEESLRIISDMITRTKVNIRQGSFHLLFWGWLIFACSISDYLLIKFSDFTHPFYVWIFIIPGIFVSLIYGFASGRKTRVRTYADSLYMWTWLGFMVAAIVLFIVSWKKMDTFGLYILLLAGIPTFISGFIIKFRPLVAGGISFWIIVLIIHFSGTSLAPLGMPVAMLTGYLIPGYMLKSKVNNDTV